jgi:hypothetical protein
MSKITPESAAAALGVYLRINGFLASVGIDNFASPELIVYLQKGTKSHVPPRWQRYPVRVIKVGKIKAAT